MITLAFRVGFSPNNTQAGIGALASAEFVSSLENNLALAIVDVAGFSLSSCATKLKRAT